MLAAIIPARNEAHNLPIIYECLATLPFDKIITVVNGCIDDTLQVISRHAPKNHFMIYFSKPLGVDVPRAIGALKALAMGCTHFCFVDGDMSGDIRKALLSIITSIQGDTDLALINCYPIIRQRTPLTNTVLHFRGKLNRLLDLYNDIGLASPSHGPHGISSRLLRLVPPWDLAIPPSLLVHAYHHNLNIKVVDALPHQKLGSTPRNESHAISMAHTIVGDCLEAISMVHTQPRTRIYQGFEFSGYDPERRFDILHEYVKTVTVV